MFVRILSLIRLARVSRLVRFFNEVEKVGLNSGWFKGSGGHVGQLQHHGSGETAQVSLEGPDTRTGLIGGCGT